MELPECILRKLKQEVLNSDRKITEKIEGRRGKG